MKLTPQVKKTIKIVALALISAIVLIAVIRTAYYRSLTAPNALKEATTHWNTYKVEECSCSFKYPEDWEVIAKKDSSAVLEADRQKLLAVLIKPKNVPNDWIHRSSTKIQTGEYDVTTNDYKFTIIESEYVRDGEATRSGIVFFPGGSYTAYNSGEGPWLKLSSKLGDRPAVTHVGRTDIFSFSWYEKRVEIISTPKVFDLEKSQKHSTVNYSWPPTKTIVQTLATFDFDDY